MPLLKGHQDDATRMIVPLLLSLLTLFVLLELIGAVDVVDGFGVSRVVSQPVYTIPLQ